MPSEPENQISNRIHPDYRSMAESWEKFRIVFEGGQDFKDKYLKKFSLREENQDFLDRCAMTPIPAHAKAAVVDIKNSIYQRLVDIKRINGSRSYTSAIEGKNGGVDFTGNTMTGFIGRIVLPELLSMGKVGIFIDKPVVQGRASLAETRGLRPYIYKYNTEDIRSWSFDDQNVLQVLLLRDFIEVKDEFGLVKSLKKSFRLLTLTGDGVLVQMFNENGAEIIEDSMLLNLTEIPFVIFVLSQSLLRDVADHQIALLNMGSSDVNYAIKSNFPFYTEQINPLSMLPNVKQPGDSSTSVKSGTAGTAEIKVGVTQGRGYPKGLDRPGFIHPSSEPLLASMRKQAELREEIRLLVNLSLTNIEPRRASAESKALDEHSLEAGLSYIGLELEYGERRIGHFWSAYDRAPAPTVTYPTNYSLRSEEERRTEARELGALQDKVASSTYQKALAREIATITVGNKVDDVELAKIHAEIDKSTVSQIDSKTLVADHKEGFVSTSTASKLRGYPEGEAEKAEEDHAKRMAKMPDQINSTASKDEKVGKPGRGDQKQLTADEKVSDE